MSEMDENFVSRNSVKWFFFIVATTIFFRVFNFAQFSFWTDEISTLWVSSAPTISETWNRAAATQGMHPLYFLIQHIVLKIFPASEAVLRGLSCASSIVSVFLLFWLAKIIFKDEIRPLIAAAIFAIHADSIYYAQEARPYAIALMFALFSQLLFFKLSGESKKIGIYCFYVFCSVITVYMHYTFAALFLFQNLYIFSALFTRTDGKYFIKIPPIKDWLILQLICAIFIIFSLPHAGSVYQARAAWTWIKDLDFGYALLLFVSMLDIKILLIMLCVAFVFFFNEKIMIKDVFARLEIKPSVLLLIWLLTPFIFVFAISKLTGTPFFERRYMVFAMPAYYLLLANFLDIFRSDVLRISFPGIYLILYLGLISVPLYSEYGAFCGKITHNWQNALSHIRENFHYGDAVLLRYGEIKENWIASNPPEIIKEYVSAPFRTYYWDEGSIRKLPPIFNLTFSWDKEFYPYYDFIFNDLCKYKRVWLIGVNPPNTNYRIEVVPKFMCNEFSFRQITEANYSGLYLALLESNPVLRQKLIVPSYYEELRQEIKKEQKRKKENGKN